MIDPLGSSAAPSLAILLIRAILRTPMRQQTMSQRTFRKRAGALEELSARFDHLLERMQTPASRRGMEAAFDASPDEMSRTACEQAQHVPDP